MISIFYRDNSKFRANEFKEASAFALQPPVEDTSWNG